MNIAFTLVVLLFASLAIASPIDNEDFQIPEELSSIHTISANTEPNAVDHQRVASCGQFCSFRLCNFNGESCILDKVFFTILNSTNTACLPCICKPRSNIGMVNGSLEARVFFRGNFVPISGFTPRGLNARFNKNFIQTFQIPFLPWSGISRPATQGNQWDFLHDRCMILPVTKYEEIDPDPQLPQKIVNTRGTSTNCVAFRTTAPAIQIELCGTLETTLTFPSPSPTVMSSTSGTEGLKLGN